MNKLDKELGLNRLISRRDFIGGTSLAIAGASVGALNPSIVSASKFAQGYYPPELTGLRGNHAGSFEIAHALGRHGLREWGAISEADQGVYDLVVVGAGISGLSAAHFFLQKNPNASILILDNHDDFGGHAKRNEFELKGKTIIGHGGSQTITMPAFYPDEAKRLLKDLAIDCGKFKQAYDQTLYKKAGMGKGVYFDRATFGEDKLLLGDIGDRGYLPGIEGGDIVDVIPQMPISEAAKKELHYLFTERSDQVKNKNLITEGAYFSEISYQEFLKTHMGIKEQETFAFLANIPGDDGGMGLDIMPAAYGFYLGLPGFKATSLGKFSWILNKSMETFSQDYIYHFPDGNASVARMLVRKMIPDVAPGSTMEDIVLAKFDYSKLDESKSPVRIRLNSTVVNAEHVGKVGNAEHVDINYVRAGQAYRVRAKYCVMACYNQIIPHLCPSLPIKQKQALAEVVKIPLIYTNVLLDNWRAWEKLKIASAYSPGTYHSFSMLDFPVSLGDYQFSLSPDDPIIVHMQRVPIGKGKTQAEQNRAGRHELFVTPFEKIERETRIHLVGMLSEGGFDSARDIKGITVNRWSHGYAPSFFNYDGETPNVTGRKAFGRITIANSDAGANAMLEEAVVQAHRAVEELDLKG